MASKKAAELATQIVSSAAETIYNTSSDAEDELKSLWTALAQNIDEYLGNGDDD